MITKAKSLYQVKLILECLPEEEYKLIPQETINYIEDNFEYDENIVINPNIPLEQQKIDDKTYEFLDKVLKDIEKIEKQKSINADVSEYISKVKKENEDFNAKIEIIMLKEIIESLKKENSKIPKAKALIKDYQELVNKKDKEINDLKQDNIKLYENIQKIPIVLRKIFIKI